MVDQPPIKSTEKDEFDTTDEQLDFRPSKSQELDHSPDAFTVGYDPTGSTRVGSGRSKGRTLRLIRLNEGRHHADGRHSIREAARDKKRIIQSFCSILEVTPHQQREAVAIIGRLNLDRFGQQKRLEKVALGIIRFVVDSDRERHFFEGQDPTKLNFRNVDLSRFPPKFAENPQYRALCKQYNLSGKDQYSISQLIKRELKRTGYFSRARSGRR
ncbi:DNA-directed RNA polymerase subunit epsilon [Haladaptatus sp. GCM10025707]|uniref:DNA-directed RNA polymerase subunit epsilon n=1 Tax=unclassified Haladaptatus TaxID=2622732 RepID=UPI0023E7F1C3|nr:DNA-directed RNA polymerase subunit epsilon [Haladaptatus sp. QDMS2]